MLGQMKWATEEAERAESLPELLGIEGNAARIYFAHLSGIIKPDDEPWSVNSGKPLLTFDFTTRNRRPPRDPVNALLSLAYSVLAKDLTIDCQAVGFDPFMGFYHQPRFGRADGTGSDGAVPAVDRRFGSLDGHQYADGAACRLRSGRALSGPDAGWQKGLFSGLRTADGYARHPSEFRLSCQLPADAGDPDPSPVAVW